jgi:hypothetical protein
VTRSAAPARIRFDSETRAAGRLHGRLVDGIGAPHGEGAPEVILIQWITWPMFGMHPCFAGCTLLGSTVLTGMD